jgi:hypothetical protein
MITTLMLMINPQVQLPILYSETASTKSNEDKIAFKHCFYHTFITGSLVPCYVYLPRSQHRDIDFI